MKKLNYFLYLLIGLLLIVTTSCEKDDDIVPNDDGTENPNTEVTYVGGIIIDTYLSDINSVIKMSNPDIIHSIPSMTSTLKSSKSSDNFVLIDDGNGNIDTLRLSDGGNIRITGIDDIYPINDNFLLFDKGHNSGIDMTYEILNHEYVTVYDSIPADSTTSYTIVDTTFVDEEMWLVYYDTIDVVVDTTYDVVNYTNILYNVTDGTFFDLADDIDVYNERITKSFNDPFYKNSDKSKFYYLNVYNKVIEVDLSNGSPITNIIFDPNVYGNISKIYIFDDNIIYMPSSGNEYRYITKNGTSEKLNQDIISNDVTGTLLPIHFTFVSNDVLYLVNEDFDNGIYNYFYFVYDDVNDSIYLEKSDLTSPIVSSSAMSIVDVYNIYEYSDDNFNYYFNRGDNVLLSISKLDLTYNNDDLSISNTNGVNVSIENQTKMAKFINGFIIYTSEGIYVVNTGTKSKSTKTSISVTEIVSGYKIKDMTTDKDGNVVFYGKNPSGDNIKGVINSDNTITETPIEYDSNGTIITDLD